MLPDLSAYFGVTIDELFALSDETRMERIQNMIWDERELDGAVVVREEAFLLEKARKEPENGKPLELLADLENKVAPGTPARRRSSPRRPWPGPLDQNAHSELVQAMGGRCPDWCVASHHKLIDWYKDFLEKNPDNRARLSEALLDQMLDDQRFEEARYYCDRLAKVDRTFRTPLYRGLIAWYAGERQEAMDIWEQMCRDFP